MHHRAGERAVGARLDHDRQIGLLHCPVHVDIDGHDPGAALLAGAGRVGHHVDLGVDRIGPPDHHEVRFRHLARIGAGDLAGAGGKAGPGGIVADGLVERRVALDVAQPVDAVAHHQAHGAGIVVGPDRFRPVTLFGEEEFLRDQIERVVPRDRDELARALLPLAPQRDQQSCRVVHAFGVARHLGADHARRVVVVFRPAHAPDGALIQHLDFERAGRGAVVRAGRGANGLAHKLVHARTAS